MSVANKRLDNLAQVVRDHQTVVQTIHDSVSRIDTDISYLRILLTSAIINITTFITVLNEVDDIRIAVENLVHGQLSPILLPPELLERAIYSIHSELMHQVSTHANTLHSNVVGDHYRSHRFVVARQDSKLLIALTFPLTSNHYEYTLYQLQSFPVPVPGEHNAAYVTEITNLPYGVAFRSPHAHHEYLVFSTKPDLIDNSFLYTHQQSEPLRIFSTHHTCVSALLQNNRSLINRLC